jgi:hypothetical protein
LSHARPDHRRGEGRPADVVGPVALLRSAAIGCVAQASGVTGPSGAFMVRQRRADARGRSEASRARRRAHAGRCRSRRDCRPTTHGPRRGRATAQARPALRHRRGGCEYRRGCTARTNGCSFGAVGSSTRRRCSGSCWPVAYGPSRFLLRVAVACPRDEHRFAAFERPASRHTWIRLRSSALLPVIWPSAALRQQPRWAALYASG